MEQEGDFDENAAGDNNQNRGTNPPVQAQDDIKADEPPPADYQNARGNLPYQFPGTGQQTEQRDQGAGDSFQSTRPQFIPAQAAQALARALYERQCYQMAQAQNQAYIQSQQPQAGQPIDENASGDHFQHPRRFYPQQPMYQHPPIPSPPPQMYQPPPQPSPPYQQQQYSQQVPPPPQSPRQFESSQYTMARTLIDQQAFPTPSRRPDENAGGDYVRPTPSYPEGTTTQQAPGYGSGRKQSPPVFVPPPQMRTDDNTYGGHFYTSRRPIATNDPPTLLVARSLLEPGSLEHQNQPPARTTAASDALTKNMPPRETPQQAMTRVLREQSKSQQPKQRGRKIVGRAEFSRPDLPPNSLSFLRNACYDSSEEESFYRACLVNACIQHNLSLPTPPCTPPVTPPCTSPPSSSSNESSMFESPSDIPLPYYSTVSSYLRLNTGNYPICTTTSISQPSTSVSYAPSCATIPPPTFCRTISRPTPSLSITHTPAQTTTFTNQFNTRPTSSTTTSNSRLSFSSISRPCSPPPFSPTIKPTPIKNSYPSFCAVISKPTPTLSNSLAFSPTISQPNPTFLSDPPSPPITACALRAPSQLFSAFLESQSLTPTFSESVSRKPCPPADVPQQSIILNRQIVATPGTPPPTDTSPKRRSERIPGRTYSSAVSARAASPVEQQNFPTMRLMTDRLQLRNVILTKIPMPGTPNAPQPASQPNADRPLFDKQFPPLPTRGSPPTAPMPPNIQMPQNVQYPPNYQLQSTAMSPHQMTAHQYPYSPFEHNWIYPRTPEQQQYFGAYPNCSLMRSPATQYPYPDYYVVDPTPSHIQYVPCEPPPPKPARPEKKKPTTTAKYVLLPNVVNAPEDCPRDTNYKGIQGANLSPTKHTTHARRYEFENMPSGPRGRSLQPTPVVYCGQAGGDASATLGRKRAPDTTATGNFTEPPPTTQPALDALDDDEYMMFDGNMDLVANKEEKDESYGEYQTCELVTNALSELVDRASSETVSSSTLVQTEVEADIETETESEDVTEQLPEDNKEQAKIEKVENMDVDEEEDQDKNNA